MKIILISIGIRGDMEPFLAIGEILKEKGHEIICAFPEQFRNLAEDSNLKFASWGTKFIDLLESKDGKAALEGSVSGFKKMLAYIKLAMKQTETNKELVYKQYELIESKNPDRIVYNGKAVYPIIWELDNNGKTIFISPLPYMHYVKSHTHVAFNSNFGKLLNKLTFSLAHAGMITTVMITKKWLKIKKESPENKYETFFGITNPFIPFHPLFFQDRMSGVRIFKYWDIMKEGKASTGVQTKP